MENTNINNTNTNNEVFSGVENIETKKNDSITTMKVTQSIKDELISLEDLSGTQQERVAELIKFFKQHQAKRTDVFDYTYEMNEVSKTLGTLYKGIEHIITKTSREFESLKSTVTIQEDKLKDQLKESEDAHESTREILQIATNQLNEKNILLKERDEKISDLNKEIERLAGLIETKDSQIKTKDTLIENQGALLDKADKDKQDALDTLTKEKDEEIANLNNTINHLTSVRDEQNKEIGELRRKADAFKDLEIENAKLIDKLNNTTNELEKTKIDLKETTTAATTAQTALGFKEEKIAELKEELAVKNDKNKELDKLVEDKKEEVSSLKFTIKTKDIVIGDLSDKVSKLETSVTNKDDELKTKNTTINDLNGKISKLEETVVNKDSELIDLTNQINDLKEDAKKQ